MKKLNDSVGNPPDPYEDIIRAQQLDPYEKMISSDFIFKNEDQSEDKTDL